MRAIEKRIRLQDMTKFRSNQELARETRSKEISDHEKKRTYDNKLHEEMGKLEN